MPDRKQLCKNCKTRHLPPMGKKCKLQKKQTPMESDNELLRDAAIAGQVPATQTDQGMSGDGQLLKMQILQQLQKMTGWSGSRGGADDSRICNSYSYSII